MNYVLAALCVYGAVALFYTLKVIILRMRGPTWNIADVVMAGQRFGAIDATRLRELQAEERAECKCGQASCSRSLGCACRNCGSLKFAVLYVPENGTVVTICIRCAHLGDVIAVHEG